MSVPSPGDYIPQFGFTEGAQVILQGDPLTPQPNDVDPTPPRLAGRTPNGDPWYQGAYQLTLTWTNMTIDEFQRVNGIVFAAITSIPRTPITVLWPDPYRAGQYVLQTGKPDWLTIGKWSNGLLTQATLHIVDLVDS